MKNEWHMRKTENIKEPVKKSIKVSLSSWHQKYESYYGIKNIS